MRLLPLLVAAALVTPHAGPPPPKSYGSVRSAPAVQPDVLSGRDRPPVASRGRRTVPPRPVPKASRGTARRAPAGDLLLVPFGPLTERHLAALRQCENSGRYTSDPDDYHRGAYQALRSTWRSLWLRLHRPAYAALDPAVAPRRVQDAFARWLHRIAGRDQWPVCSRIAGLP